MTGGRRRWLLALGVAAGAVLLWVGGVALAGSLLSSPHAPLFASGHSAVLTKYLVKHMHAFDRTTSRAPADDQYGNPLEGKLCASESDIQYLPDPEPRNGSISNPIDIHNCGDVPVTISPPQKGDPTSPFYLEYEAFENAAHCPVLSGTTLTLDPGSYCVIFVDFPTFPWPPPGDYSDTLTFPGDVASVTVHLGGTVPPP